MAAQAANSMQGNLYWESLRSFFKPINDLLDDPKVSEVMINGDDIFYESGGKINRSDAKITESSLLAAARNLAQFVGKELLPETRELSARLPDGSRVK